MTYSIIFIVFFLPFKAIPSQARSLDVENEDPKAELSDSLLSKIIAGHPSPSRPFFVQILINTRVNKSLACGGTIIHEYFVLTAAHCMVDAADVRVEVGDFAAGSNTTAHKMHFASKIGLHAEFDRRHLQNDIAIVQVRLPFPKIRVIPLCDREAKFQTLLGTCGLGRISTGSNRAPDYLMETYFKENVFWRFDRWIQGRKDILQTKRILHDNTICYGDSGSPLYVLNGQFREPKCVYGVTSHFREFSSQLDCQGTSFFANVLYFREWIESVIARNSN